MQKLKKETEEEKIHAVDVLQLSFASSIKYLFTAEYLVVRFSHNHLHGR